MSGPKCDSYYVEDGSNELLLQAQRAEAERMARLASERLEAAVASGRMAQQKLTTVVATAPSVEQQCGSSFNILRESVPSFPSGNSSVVEIERYIAKVESMIIQITADVGRAEGLAQLRAFASTSAAATQVADWTKELQKRQENPGTKSVDNESLGQKDREELTERIVARLQGAVREEELKSIQTIVRDIHAATSASRAESLATELRLRVQRVNERIQKTQREAAESSTFMEQLRGLQGSGVEKIREELQAVLSGHKISSANLPERVNDIRARALRQINDEYAGKVIREELQRLGYLVGEEFSTLFISGGHAVVSRPEEAEYGVEMQIDASKGLLDLAVIRFSDSKDVGSVERQLRDKNVEERWCADHQKLRSAIRARGLNGRVLKHSPPGAQPVLVTNSVRTQDARRAERPKQRDKR
jgi:hypothetical protein